MIYHVNNLIETQNVAREFASKLKNGDVVLLNGDLGAGKTTFTQFVFKALGVKDVVNSPTFSILKSYTGNNVNLHHFDTYRITTDEAIEAGFDEIINDNNSIVFIEWSENIAPLLPQNVILINITILNETMREIEIKY